MKFLTFIPNFEMSLPFDVIIEIARQNWGVWYKLSIVHREFGLYSIQPNVKRAAQKRFSYQEISEQRNYFKYVHYFKIGNVLHGTKSCYYDSKMTKLRHKIQFVDGKREGPKILYDYDGNIRMSKNYLNDRLHGAFISYDKQHKIHEKHYNHGLLEGSVIHYQQPGNFITIETEYQNGKKNGIETRYYDTANSRV